MAPSLGQLGLTVEVLVPPQIGHLYVTGFIGDLPGTRWSTMGRTSHPRRRTSTANDHELNTITIGSGAKSQSSSPASQAAAYPNRTQTTSARRVSPPTRTDSTARTEHEGFKAAAECGDYSTNLSDARRAIWLSY